jgi:hypothetical protein
MIKILGFRIGNTPCLKAGKATQYKEYAAMLANGGII